jgi:hypothetical protein
VGRPAAYTAGRQCPPSHVAGRTDQLWDQLVEQFETLGVKFPTENCRSGAVNVRPTAAAAWGRIYEVAGSQSTR